LFIDREKRNYPLPVLCRLMRVSQSGYYAWRKRFAKAPCARRQQLKQLVRNCYFENRRRYGTRRIQRALAGGGVSLGRCRIRRLMKEEGLKAIEPQGFKPRTTDSRGVKASPNLLVRWSRKSR
jgi:putative transposase